MLVTLLYLHENDDNLFRRPSDGTWMMKSIKGTYIYTEFYGEQFLFNSFRKNCVEGIIPNKEKIKSNLDNSLMLVTALAPYIGYDKSAQVAKYAYDKKLTLRDSVIELNYMSGEDFDKKVNPEKMINPYKLK